MKFCDLAKLWLSGKQQEGLSYVYLKELSYAVDHLNDFLREKQIDEIKPLDIDCVIKSLTKLNPNTNRPMSKKGLKDIRNTAKSIFDLAVENELIIRNPAQNRKIPKNAPMVSRRALTPEEQKLIMKTSHTRCRCAVLIMMLCGLRTGELLALEWNDVDIEKEVVHVRQSVQRVDTNCYRIHTGTKNGKTRDIPIPKLLLSELRLEKTRTSQKHVCAQLNGELHTPSSWRSLWRSYCLSLNQTAQGSVSKYSPGGLPKIISHITPHMLRHTYCTLLYKAGIDVLVAQYLMGHSSIKVTLDIYTHLDEEHRIKKINEFDRLLDDSFFVSRS